MELKEIKLAKGVEATDVIDLVKTIEKLAIENKLLKKELKLKDDRHEAFTQQYDLVHRYSEFGSDGYGVGEDDQAEFNEFEETYNKLDKKIKELKEGK